MQLTLTAATHTNLVHGNRHASGLDCSRHDKGRENRAVLCCAVLALLSAGLRRVTN